MAYDGNGTFNRLYNWQADAANGINIMADRMDAEFDGVAEALSLAFLRDGQVAMQADADIGNNRLLRVANPTLDTDGVNKKWVDDNFLSSSGNTSIKGDAPGIIFEETDQISDLNKWRIRVSGTSFEIEPLQTDGTSNADFGEFQINRTIDGVSRFLMNGGDLLVDNSGRQNITDLDIIGDEDYNIRVRFKREDEFEQGTFWNIINLQPPGSFPINGENDNTKNILQYSNTAFDVIEYIAAGDGRHDFYCGTVNLDAAIDSFGFYMFGDNGLNATGPLRAGATIDRTDLSFSGGVEIGHGGTHCYFANYLNGNIEFRFAEGLDGTVTKITPDGDLLTEGKLTVQGNSFYIEGGSANIYFDVSNVRPGENLRIFNRNITNGSLALARVNDDNSFGSYLAQVDGDGGLSLGYSVVLRDAGDERYMTRVSSGGTNPIDDLTFKNKEASGITQVDGTFGFDSSRGMIVYRAAVTAVGTEGVYTVLDTGQIREGKGIKISNRDVNLSDFSNVAWSVDTTVVPTYDKTSDHNFESGIVAQTENGGLAIGNGGIYGFVDNLGPGGLDLRIDSVDMLTIFPDGNVKTQIGGFTTQNDLTIENSGRADLTIPNEGTNFRILMDSATYRFDHDGVLANANTVVRRQDGDGRYAGQRSWSNVTASRVADGRAYTNDTGKEIEVHVHAAALSGTLRDTRITAYLNGVLFSRQTAIDRNSAEQHTTVSLVVPNGATYGFDVEQGTLQKWWELR